MKKILSFLIMLIVLVTLVQAAHAAVGIKIYIDGAEIECEVPPRIINDRTMVPARVVFENLDANVEWDSANYQVHIDAPDAYIVFTIGDKSAILNGKTVTLDAAPMILHDRTMVPIRFVSENLGYDVDWHDATKSVFITSPQPEEEYVSDVLSVDTVDKRYSTNVVIKLSEGVEPKVSTLGEPFRIILDFYNTSLSTKDGKLSLGNIHINEVRWAMHEDYSRIVIEASGDMPYEIIGDGTRTITVKVGDKDTTPDSTVDNSDIGDEPEEDEDTTEETEDTEDEDIVIPAFEDMVIVLDAGHGGKDVGAVAKDDNGNDIVDTDGYPVLTEKDLNLYIAQKVRYFLKKSGVTVLMTRDDDTFVGTNKENLLARCDFANQNNATLFVSIHNNSAASPKATGTEICYTEESSGKYGITSKSFAQNVLPLLVDATGLTDRGLVNRPNLVVLKNTTMPAILIECAFLTCEKDRQVLMDTDKLDEISEAIAEGIVMTMEEIDAKR